MDHRQKAYLENRVLAILSRRDHSELEIIQKFRKWATDEEITYALKFAKSYKLIPDSLEEEHNLSRQVAQFYHQKNLGILRIQQKLATKGLPEVTPDPEEELSKASRLLATRRSRSQKPLTKAQLLRYLVGRGFKLDIAYRAIKKLHFDKIGEWDEQADTEPDS